MSLAESSAAPAAPAGADRATLQAELQQLNERLRALRWPDVAARAYAEMWLAFLAWSVTGKLVWDWQRSLAKAPWLAVPIGILAIVLTVDLVVQKRRQKRIQREEEAALVRQRDLRLLLGIDDAPLPGQSGPAEEAATRQASAGR